MYTLDNILDFIKKQKNDELPINHQNKETPINPDYYKGNIETIDYIEQITTDLTGLEAICVFNIIKYISRYSKKNGIEDVKKSQWYLNKLIKFLENK
jgi:hypothetical protein